MFGHSCNEEVIRIWLVSDYKITHICVLSVPSVKFNGCKLLSSFDVLVIFIPIIPILVLTSDPSYIIMTCV